MLNLVQTAHHTHSYQLQIARRLLFGPADLDVINYAGEDTRRPIDSDDTL